MITMPCSLAISCIKRTVGPSGIRSTASYQRVFCSAQKYGVVKTSCIQMICTPCFAACSIKPRCFSMLSRFISSIGASVGAALVHWISPHLTVRGISCSFYLLRLEHSDGQFIALRRDTYLEERGLMSDIL